MQIACSAWGNSMACATLLSGSGWQRWDANIFLIGVLPVYWSSIGIIIPPLTAFCTISAQRDNTEGEEYKKFHGSPEEAGGAQRGVDYI